MIPTYLSCTSRPFRMLALTADQKIWAKSWFFPNRGRPRPREDDLVFARTTSSSIEDDVVLDRRRPARVVLDQLKNSKLWIIVLWNWTIMLNLVILQSTAVWECIASKLAFFVLMEWARPLRTYGATPLDLIANLLTFQDSFRHNIIKFRYC